MYYNETNLESLTQEEHLKTKLNLTETKIESAKTIVLKFGTDAVKDIFNKTGKTFIEDIVTERKKGKKFIIISSGAINLGKQLEKLNFTPKNNFQNKNFNNINHNKNSSYNKTIKDSVYAALGQPLLMFKWYSMFNDANILVSQVLYENENLTGNSSHRQYIHDGIYCSLENNIIPIVNENDAVTSEEIKQSEIKKSFDDNDHLANLITNMINADLLIYFTKSGGIFKELEKQETLYNAIFLNKKESTDKLLENFTDFGSSNGKGGISSKLKYSIELANKGIPVVIAGSQNQNCLNNALFKHENHTIIVPKIKY